MVSFKVLVLAICLLVEMQLVASLDDLHGDLSEDFMKNDQLLRSKEDGDVVDFKTVKKAIVQMFTELNTKSKTINWNESKREAKVFLHELLAICELDRSNCTNAFELIELVGAKIQPQERNLVNYLNVCKERQGKICPSSRPNKLVSLLPRS